MCFFRNGNRLVITKRLLFWKFSQSFFFVLDKMAIYRPKVVHKSKSTRSGDKEHGAEVICLHDEDFQHNNNPDYFKIKLAYNNVHHYMPVVPKAISGYLDDYNTA